MKLIVERIYNNLAILEKDDLTHIEIELKLLPAGLKEGSVLSFDGTDYYLDTEAEEEARLRIINKQRSVFKKP